MQLQLLALLAALGAASASFTVPTGQTDGVYSVYTDASGQEIYTRLDAESTTCSSSGMLNPTDTNNANAALDAQCGSGAYVGGNKDFYSISGGTVSFFCNFSGDGQICTAAARQQAAVSINSVCGNYHGGWQDPTPSESYGWDVSSSKFCGRGP